MIRISVSLHNAALNFKKHIPNPVIVVLSGKSQYYSGSDIELVKQRQYNMFWQSYDFERFKIISNKAAENMLFIQQTAHRYLQELEKVLDYETSEKIHFIVFNSQSEFRQSNIGLETNNITSNIGGALGVKGIKYLSITKGII